MSAVNRLALVNWTLRNRIAGVAYRETKADHALPDGCDWCCKGYDTRLRSARRWRFYDDLLLCGSCARSARCRGRKWGRIALVEPIPASERGVA